MPNFQISNGKVDSIAKRTTTTIPRTYVLNIKNTAVDNQIARATSLEITRIDFRYYRNLTQKNTISYVTTESQRVEGVEIYYDSSDAILFVAIDIRDFESNILRYNSLDNIRITFSDNTVGNIVITDSNRLYQDTPTNIRSQNWSTYLATRSITSRGLNYDGNDALIYISHNLDTSHAIFTLTNITNFTTTESDLFPIQLTSRPIERRVLGQYDLTQTSQYTIHVFPYNKTDSRIQGNISAVASTQINVSPSPEPEVLPSRQRFVIQSAFINESNTGIIFQCVSYPDPIPSFFNLVIQKSTNPNFNVTQSRTYNAQSSTNVYGDSLPNQGTTYYRITVNRSAFNPIITNIWKVRRSGDDYFFEELIDYTDVLSGMKILITSITATTVSFRFESDHFLTQPIESLSITATATNQTTRTTTAIIDGESNFVNATVPNLTASTEYNFRIDTLANSFTYVITNIKQKTIAPLPAMPTTEQTRAYNEEKLIRENLLNQEADNLMTLPQECHDRFIEYMLSLKSVWSGNYHGPDRNPKNYDISKQEQQRATRYSSDVKINVDDLIDVISTQIPDPDEDTDLILEANL